MKPAKPGSKTPMYPGAPLKKASGKGVVKPRTQKGLNPGGLNKPAKGKGGMRSK
jgi:hypothetical protein